MKTFVKAVFFSTMLIFTAVVVNAQTNDPGIEKRQKIQQKRIKQGVKSGELTPQEAVKLNAEQKKIEQQEQKMKADDKLTKKERAKLHKEQNKASRHIYKEKHDQQKVQ